MDELERIQVFCGTENVKEYIMDKTGFDYFELNKNFKYMKDLYNVFMIYDLNKEDEELIMQELGESLKESFNLINKLKAENYMNS